MNFFHTPYRSGVALREDIFHRQFEVWVTGMTEYPEDDPVYGTYEREETLTVCTSDCPKYGTLPHIVTTRMTSIHCSSREPADF